MNEASDIDMLFGLFDEFDSTEYYDASNERLTFAARERWPLLSKFSITSEILDLKLNVQPCAELPAWANIFYGHTNQKTATLFPGGVDESSRAADERLILLSSNFIAPPTTEQVAETDHEFFLNVEPASEPPRKNIKVLFKRLETPQKTTLLSPETSMPAEEVNTSITSMFDRLCKA